MDLSKETESFLNDFLSPLTKVEKEFDDAKSEWRKKEKGFEDKIKSIKSNLPNENDIELLKFLSSSDKIDKVILLPVDFTKEHECFSYQDFDLFASYRDLLDGSDESQKKVINQILKYEPFFDSGYKKIVLNVSGKMGWLGYQFKKLINTVLHDDVVYAIRDESWRFFIESHSLIECEVKHIDYYNDNYCEAEYKVYLIWLKRKQV